MRVETKDQLKAWGTGDIAIHMGHFDDKIL